MSKNFKNQNRHNYNQYANKTETAQAAEQEEVKDEAITSDINEEIVEETEVTEEVKDEVVNQVPKPQYGIVNCAKLNVRRGPSIDTTSLCVVEGGSKLDIENFNEEWLKVLTEYGVSGYCMKKFVDVK